MFIKLLWHVSPVLHNYVIQCLLVLLNSSWTFAYYDGILDTLGITNKKLLHFKHSTIGQILCLDKIGFPRPGHIFYAKQKHLGCK